MGRQNISRQKTGEKSRTENRTIKTKTKQNTGCNLDHQRKGKNWPETIHEGNIFKNFLKSMKMYQAIDNKLQTKYIH